MPSTPRSRSTASAHQEAVARRLAELCAQLGTPLLPADDEPVVVERTMTSRARSGAARAVAPAAGADWWEDHTHPPQAPQPAHPPLQLVPGGRPAVADDVFDPDPVPVPTPIRPVCVPEPGRHASRRPSAASAGVAHLVADLVPQTLRGRVRLGISQLVVVTMLVALGLGVVLWSLARSRPTSTDLASAALPPGLPSGAPSGTPTAPVLASSGSPSESPGSPGSPSSSSSGASVPAVGAGGPAGGRLTVDVAGRVRRPGIEVLPAGSRVVDALRRAGGARPGVDLTPLNLARPLVDGEQILVGVAGATLAPTPGTGTTAGAGPGATTTGLPATPTDLNTATEKQLEALPDVGPVTAGSILSWRQAHGGFTSVDELLEVDGIGPATLAKLTPYVTV